MKTAPLLRAVFLGSGSSGNATAVTDGSTTVLVDCGFSAREAARRLAEAGIEASSVAAVLVTHEHGDHVRGIEVFCRRHAPGCAVYATRGTLLRGDLDRAVGDSRRLVRGEPVRVGTLEVLAFATSHDAAEPCGFRIASGGSVFGLATDTGVLTPEAAEALAGCETLGLESNHDVEMLERGPYPWHLKRRISSAAGHLSNADAAEALERLAHDGLRRVVALHRSRTNNTARLAGTALRARAARLDLAVEVSVAEQGTPCDTRPPQTTLFESAG